jgi:hypothetical protein
MEIREVRELTRGSTFRTLLTKRIGSMAYYWHRGCCEIVLERDGLGESRIVPGTMRVELLHMETP